MTETKARLAIAAVIEEMHRIDRLMSTWKPESEISRVNREAAAGPVVASDELRMLIQKGSRRSPSVPGAPSTLPMPAWAFFMTIASGSSQTKRSCRMR